MSAITPSIAQLKRAILISEQIERLQAELGSIFGGSGAVPTGKRKYTKKTAAEPTSSDEPKAAKKRKKRTMSPEGRAAIVAAQKARWAAKKAKK